MRCLNLQSLRPLLQNEAVKVGWRGKIAGTKKEKEMGKKAGNYHELYNEAKKTDVDGKFTKRGKGASE